MGDRVEFPWLFTFVVQPEQNTCGFVIMCYNIFSERAVMRLAFGMAHAHPPLSHVCAILRVWGQDYDMPCSLPGKLFLNTACRTPKDSVGLFSTGH